MLNPLPGLGFLHLLEFIFSLQIASFLNGIDAAPSFPSDVEHSIHFVDEYHQGLEPMTVARDYSFRDINEDRSGLPNYQLTPLIIPDDIHSDGLEWEDGATNFIPMLYEDNFWYDPYGQKIFSQNEFGIFTREELDDNEDEDDDDHSHGHSQGHRSHPSSHSHSNHGHHHSGHDEHNSHGDGHGYDHGHHPGDGYCDGQGDCYNTDVKDTKEQVTEVIKLYPEIRKKVIHHVLNTASHYGPEVANEAHAHFNKHVSDVRETFEDILAIDDGGHGHGHGHGHGYSQGHEGGHGGHGYSKGYKGGHGGQGYSKGYKGGKGHGGHGYSHGHGHGGYPYGYGGYNKNFGQPKGEPDLWSRRQDWDYATHDPYQTVDLGHHPLDKYQNSWSHNKGHSGYW